MLVLEMLGGRPQATIKFFFLIRVSKTWNVVELGVFSRNYSYNVYRILKEEKHYIVPNGKSIEFAR